MVRVFACFALALALLLLTDAAPPVSQAGSASGLLGDANCSEKVDPVDSLNILRHDAAIATAPCAELADVQCDGDVDVIDSLQILRWDSGLTTIQQPGCPSIGEPLELGPTSFELINAALDGGQLTDEEALTYRVFVVFGDERLPAEYKGDDDGEFDGTGTVMELSATFDTLSPSAQETLAPFLKSWEEPDSWYQARLTAPQAAIPAGVPLDTVDSSANVRIWYRTDIAGADVEAAALAGEIDAEIWPDLTGLMGPPMDDSARVPNGGDGRVDILLSGLPHRATATPDPGCKATSGYVTLGVGYSNYEVVAHELMHVILYRYAAAETCQSPEYHWAHEATAQWAIDYVYPDSQREWGSSTRPTAALACFLDKPNQSLESRDDCHEYGAYLFFFYLARFHGAHYIPAIWGSFATHDSLSGINSALATIGGFKEIWPKFEMYNLNREPRLDYKTKDSILLKVALEKDENVTLGGKDKETYTLRGDVDHLGAFFHQYTFTDADIRYVKFTHELTGQQTAYVRALIKYEGDSNWKDEEWTPDKEKEFCFDDPGQKKIEKLFIIISNSEYQNRSHVLTSNPQPELEVRSECGISGQAVATYTFFEGYHEDWQVIADIEWVEDPDYFFGCPCRVFFPEGEITWTWELGWDSGYSDPPCNEAYSGSLQAGTGLSHKSEQMLILWEDPENEDRYYYQVEGYVPVTITSMCEGGDRVGLSFLDLQVPELEFPEPSIPPIPTIPPLHSIQGGTCEETYFTTPRDTLILSGSCVDQTGLLEYEWDFSLPSQP